LHYYMYLLSEPVAHVTNKVCLAGRLMFLLRIPVVSFCVQDMPEKTYVSC